MTAAAGPELLAALTPDEMYSMSGEALASIQLSALRMRFADLVGQPCACGRSGSYVELA